MSKSLVVLLMALSFSTAQATDISFAISQKWTVKDSGITIVIGRINPFPGGKTAISVSLFDVPCPPWAGCTTMTVARAPFYGDALAKSVDKLVTTGAQTAPQFQQGYENWTQAKGGVLTVPVSRMPELLFKATGNTRINGN